MRSFLPSILLAVCKQTLVTMDGLSFALTGYFKHYHLWGFCRNIEAFTYQGIPPSQGIAFSIAGPTLLDLACHTKSKLENMSYIFTSLSVGYLTGNMVGGWLYDKFNKLCVMSLSCLVTTLFMWVSPLPTNLYALMVLISAMAFAGGALNTGENSVLK